MKHKLYLIPTSLGDTDLNSVLPDNITKIVSSIKVFIVENIRTARRYLKKLNKNIIIDDLTFYVLNKHTDVNDLDSFLSKIDEFDIGIISESGCPAVADPGSDIVSIAQRKNIKVVPLVGPSSILLSLMASGFNGQNFAFNGYLPVKSHERQKKLNELELKVFKQNQTQIFIETPYRNNQMLDEILKTCSLQLKICVACNLTLDDEFIITKPVSFWKKNKLDLNKKFVVFLLGK